MSCFGLCEGKAKTNKYDEMRIVYNKAADSVVIETQTSDPAVHQTTHASTAILDCGSSKLKAGFAGDENPLVKIPTIVGKCTSDDTIKKIFGSVALASTDLCKLSYPMQNGLIKDWHDVEDLFEYVIDHSLDIQPKQHELLFVQAPNNPFSNQEKIAEMMFEKLEFNSCLLASSTLMGMFGYGSTTGVIVESGAGQTHIMAIKDGRYIEDSYRHIPLGGDDLTRYLGQLLSQSGKSQYFQGKRNAHEILNDIKHVGCHVVINYDEAIKRFKLNPDFVPNNAVLPDGTMIGIKSEAFQVPELLFKPEIIGIQTGGIAQNIYECIESCDPKLKEELYCNICLCGGNTMFEGFEDRLMWEVKSYAGRRVTVIINAPPNRDNLIFLGASLLSVCPKFKDNLISYQEYREVGPQIVHYRSI